MPATNSTRSARLINQMVDQIRSDTNQQFPQLSGVDITQFRHRPQAELSAATIPNQSLDSQVSRTVRSSASLAKISTEEYQSVLQKLMLVLDQQPGQLDEDSQLYLEQQLSEILGITISSSINDMKLPYHTGLVKALSHQPRSPEDVLGEHQNHTEAGMTDHRGYYGWLNAEQEKYFVSLPLQRLSDWVGRQDQILPWFKNRKVVLINPYDQRAVVAVVGDVNIRNNIKYQFGASPEIIREGLLWSPKAKGRTCLFFVDDSANSANLGLIDFAYD